jgi:hypothetical protein
MNPENAYPWATKNTKAAQSAALNLGGPSRTQTITWGGSMGWLKQVPIAPRRNRKF